ncbi:MAG: flagellar hook-basal body complex protein [Bryobacter sp.]|nr:flagellar hook-basal body complex protein [Bryobacter sp.]
MDFATTVLAGGLRSRAESLDVLANNLANTNTAAFKADMQQFQVYVPDWVAADPVLYEGWAKAPDLGKSKINFVQGSLERTDAPLDLAIEGEGFFTLEGGAAQSEAKYLTRAGSFQIGQDGQIRNADGLKLKLLPVDGGPLPPNFRLDPNQPIKFRQDGVILQDNQERARVSIAGVDAPEDLLREGKSYFAYDTKAVAERQRGFTLHQGMLERSNFDPMAGAVQLVNITRQFEMLQKALQLHGEMGRRVSEEIGKV